MSQELNQTRRHLLKGFLSGAATIPIAASSIASCRAAEYRSGSKWDREVDVVVVGYGGAGAAAAIGAHNKGAKVLVLEKMTHGGGNTAVSGGGFIIPEDAQKAQEYLTKIYAFADNDCDEALVQAFCKGAADLKNYFASLSSDIRLRVYGHANYPQLPNADTITKFGVRGRRGGGHNLFDALDRQVREVRQIEVMFNTPGLQLVRRGNEVVGIVAQHGGKEIRIKAKKGVILTTGGFEYDAEMLQNFAMGTQIHGTGNPGNTGDGLRMSMTMGAKLWHMTSYSCPLGIKIPGHEALAPFAAFGPSYICVNQDGKRFVNEIGVDFHAWLYSVNTLDVIRHRFPNIPCYAVFDDGVKNAGPLAYTTLGYVAEEENYKWSKDSEAEIKSGVVKRAQTLEELASIIKVPAEALKATIARWNSTIVSGDDPDFGRRRQRDVNAKSTGLATGSTALLSAPLSENGPYYAVELYPALLNTQGGPKRLPNAQLIDAEDNPIPRLFAAGELGSIWGSFYQGSSNIAECLVFGNIAGETAAGLDVWK